MQPCPCIPLAFAFQSKVQLLIDLDSSADFKYSDFKYWSISVSSGDSQMSTAWEWNWEIDNIAIVKQEKQQLMNELTNYLFFVHIARQGHGKGKCFWSGKEKWKAISNFPDLFLPDNTTVGK